MKVKRIGFWTFFSVVTLLGLFALAQAQQGPVVTITNPATDTYTINQPKIDILGTVVEANQIELQRVWWTNISVGSTQVNTLSSTDWDHTWDFDATVNNLIVGGNVIIIWAQDVAGQIGYDTINVTYDPSAPGGGGGGLLPDGTIGDMTTSQYSARLLDYHLTKAKLTFYLTYNNLDRFSSNIYGLLLPQGWTDPYQHSKDFFANLVSNQDVTVTYAVNAPGLPNRIQIFSQMIPANTAVPGPNPFYCDPLATTIPKVCANFPPHEAAAYEYGYHLTGKNLNDLDLVLLLNSKTNQYYLYFYGFGDQLNHLPTMKASMSTAQYTQFVKSITDFQVTVTIGNSTWQGVFPLKVENYTTSKVELTYGR